MVTATIGDVLWPLPLILGLIFLHAVFVAADYGLIKVHFTRFDTGLLERAKRRKTVTALMASADRNARAIRFGGIACTLAVGALSVFIAEGILDLLSPDTRESGTVGLVWIGCFVAAWFLHTLIGELVPRALGIRYPIQAIGASSWFIRSFAFLMRPVAALLEGAAGRLLRLLNAEAGRESSLIDVEVQIRSLLSDGDEVSPITERILGSALGLRNLVVQDVLIPRNRLQYFDTEDDIQSNIEAARKSGHTRFPLCEGDLDHCVGLIHIKDLFRQRSNLNELNLQKFRREIQRFSVDAPLDYVLERLLQQKSHMALAVDEFGGAVGVITLEDVLEELVGDIHDEFDREESQVQPLDDGWYQVDGLTPLQDVAEQVGVELSDSEVSTFGGLITSELGRMPREGQTCTIGPLEVTVTAVSEKRVLSARVRKPPEPKDEPGQGDEG